MISLNLISKKRKIAKGRNIFQLVLYSLFGLFTLYFVFQVVFVTVNLYLTNQKLTEVRKNSATLSGQILKDNEKLNNFILSKFILTEITKLRRDKFAYKDYLNQIVTMLPAGNEVKTVGFETKGFVAVTMASADDASFRALENNTRSVDLTDTFFE
jgi:uncharacterized protein YpmS